MESIFKDDLQLEDKMRFKDIHIHVHEQSNTLRIWSKITWFSGGYEKSIWQVYVGLVFMIVALILINETFDPL